MITSEILRESGTFEKLAETISSYVALGLLALLDGAVLMNDAAMYIIIPICLAMGSLQAVPVIAALVNLGSSITPFGNPQNVIIWSKFNVPILTFIIKMTIGLLTPIAVSLLLLKGTEKVRLKERFEFKPIQALLGTGLLIASVILVKLKLEILALSITFFSYLATFKKMPRLQWKVLVLLSLMILGFNALSGVVTVRIEDHKGTFLLSIGLSQVISNVPATLVLIGSTKEWYPLALGVNAGGLGTPIASLANLIAISLSDVDLIGFMKINFLLLLTAIVWGISVLSIW